MTMLQEYHEHRVERTQESAYTKTSQGIFLLVSYLATKYVANTLPKSWKNAE